MRARGKELEAQNFGWKQIVPAPWHLISLAGPEPEGTLGSLTSMPPLLIWTVSREGK
jgi:hypothetical protein